MKRPKLTERNARRIGSVLAVVALSSASTAVAANALSRRTLVAIRGAADRNHRLALASTTSRNRLRARLELELRFLEELKIPVPPPIPVTGADLQCRETSACKERGACWSSIQGCFPRYDTDCANSANCKREGTCTLWQGGKWPGCVIGSDADCRAASKCSHGMTCTRVESADGYKCLFQSK
jgi:hypothetical protein